MSAAEWNAGYVTDIPYTYGYHQQLNPVIARFFLAVSRVRMPQLLNACELGFGQGLSLNFHAAAMPGTRWWGSDFHPGQAAFARETAAIAGTGAMLSDESFEEFCARDDLPGMDFIALHGVWSWINDENRAVIVDFIRRKLNPGGLVYIGYNTHPGWSALVPLREMLLQHTNVMSAPGQNIAARIDAALAFASRLLQAQPRYALKNPEVEAKLKSMLPLDRHYLAHEFFNRDWTPMSFAQMAPVLQSAKLDFVCTSNFYELVEAVFLKQEQAALLKEIEDMVFRQSVKDLITNEQFRKDYWVRGVRHLDSREHRETLDAQRVVLLARPEKIELVLPGTDVKLSEGVYRPLIEALGDNKPRTIQEVVAGLQTRGVNAAQVLQALIMLSGMGHVAPAQSETAVDAARAGTERINRHLMNAARSNGDVQYLASPVTAGGVAIPRFHMAMLHARAQGASSPDAWANSVWKDMQALNQRITREGKQLISPEDNLADLRRDAAQLEERLPVLQGLGVA
jgi:SAM-dependent methyltransferase